MFAIEALDESDLEVEPERHEQYVSDATDAWDAESDLRREAYLEAASG